MSDTAVVIWFVGLILAGFIGDLIVVRYLRDERTNTSAEENPTD